MRQIVIKKLSKKQCEKKMALFGSFIVYWQKQTVWMD
jgi:hypothetical protein